MAKTGRPKKYNDLVQFNLYIERSDLDVLKWVVEETNKKHNTSAYTMAVISRQIFSQQIERIKKSKDYQLRAAANSDVSEGAVLSVESAPVDPQWADYKVDQK
ncbi:hypothetical protein HFK89_02935 [Ralstonia pseudosolanacearum]|uniref:hypothetical protein n=1 Tax=Ralstonia pseudosolanacearum TaxID=1310165 RepID=UPI001113AC35|nr:hypothetical protein [Ralstonia pseudosolanacearum]MCK4161422.1 hypothetical protein [Ralstonia pseudosolanacearum]